MSPFIADDGSVFTYTSMFFLRENEEIIFVVLSAYDNNVPGEHPGKMFRQYMNLMTGEVGWFSNDSHLNEKAKRLT